MEQRTSDLRYNGKETLIHGNIKTNDPFHKVLCAISQSLDILHKNDLLDCIDLKTLGITCPDDSKSKICVIMEWVTATLLTNSKSLATLSGSLNTIMTSIGQLNDSKVKVKDAGTANVLANLIDAPNSAVQFSDNKVSFYGFVPVGARTTVNKNRLSDFDSTGKGKPGTDLWGWAIRNGQNGLANALGHFPMYTDSVNNADTKGGAASFTVSKDNIATFSIPVSGTITEALQNDMKFKIGYLHVRSFDGASGIDKPVKDRRVDGNDQEWFTPGYNFKHTHGFNLTAAHTKAQPTHIELIPLHIKEIPIERIIP
jgi:hypothetical protein